MKCTVVELRVVAFGKHDKPYRFYADPHDTTGKKVNNWSHLCCVFVEWLKYNHFISPEKLPVPDHRGCGKDFINDTDQHENPHRGGSWKKVGPYYVDTKYNADDHMKNMLSTLRHLGVANPQFLISFHRG